MRILLLLGTTLLPFALHAATLKPYTTLDGPVVRLSDLFADAGPEAARVLGPGPAPGGRIVVEAPQLAAIAAQFDVDWQAASPGDRAVLEWPGRPMPRAAVVAAVRRALAASGVAPDAAILLPGLTPPLVPLHGAAAPEIEQIDYDAASGRFTATLAVVSPNAPVQRMPLAGEVEVMVAIPVAAHLLDPGTPITAADLRIAHVPAASIHGQVMLRVADALGLAPRHALAAGEPLPTSALATVPLVQRGARVLLRLDEPGLSVTGIGEALDAGGAGDQIRVVNSTSHAVLDGVVVAPGVVSIPPGSVPLRPGRGVAEVAAR
jgi:flagella basal body P-ring formation protein FlgA